MAAIDDFLSGYEPPVHDLAQALRDVVKRLAPDCSETLHTGWKVISYGHRKKFCAIAPHSRWVNLQFHEGAALEDPDGRLDGSGRSMRHVRVADVADLSAALEALVVEAAERAA